MSPSAATPAAFNPLPHLIGMGVLGAANPLIYVGRFDVSYWLTPLLGVALLVGLIFGGYRLLAPARSKAAGLKPFILLAWVLVALVTFQAWTEPVSKDTQTIPTQVVAPNTPSAAQQSSAQFDPSTERPVNDPNGFDAANAVLISQPPATKDFDPTNAVLVEIRP